MILEQVRNNAYFSKVLGDFWVEVLGFGDEFELSENLYYIDL